MSRSGDLWTCSPNRWRVQISLHHRNEDLFIQCGCWKGRRFSMTPVKLPTVPALYILLRKGRWFSPWSSSQHQRDKDSLNISTDHLKKNVKWWNEPKGEGVQDGLTMQFPADCSHLFPFGKLKDWQGWNEKSAFSIRVQHFCARVVRITHLAAGK